MRNVRLWIALAAITGCGDDSGNNNPTPDAPRLPDGPPAADGRIDGAPATSCAMPSTLSDPAEVMGTNMGAMNAIDGVCSLDVGGGGAPEVIYRVTPAATGELQVRVSSLADLAVYARTTCDDDASELGCADFLADSGDGVTPAEEGFGIASTAGTPVFVVVDGYDATTGVGSYTLQVASADNTPACTGSGVTAAAAGDNSGTTVGGSNLLAGSCTGAFTPEKVYTFTVPGLSTTDGTLTVTLASDTDQGLHLRSTCTDPTSQLVCRDAQFGGTDEVVSMPVRGGDVPFLIVEPFTAGEEGPFTLNIEYQLAVCGDGALNGFEDCDPPNAVTCGTDCRYIPEGTVTAATMCANWSDDDGDTLGDCADDGCQADAVCDVGAGAIGSACDAASDCAAATGDDPACIGETTFGWGHGYCTEHCSDSDPCPTGSRCLGWFDQTVCFKGCTAVTDCATGQDCLDPGDGNMVCAASCMGAPDCPVSGTCNVDATTGVGTCGNPEANFCADYLDNDGDGQMNCVDGDCAGNGTACPITEVEPNNTSGTANVGTAGSAFRAFISPSGDEDWVSVALLTGQTLTVETNDLGTGACTQFALDSQLALFQPDGTTAVTGGSNDDISLSNYCSRATTGAVGANGTYFVKVTASTLAEIDTFGYGLTITITGP